LLPSFWPQPPPHPAIASFRASGEKLSCVAYPMLATENTCFFSPERTDHSATAPSERVVVATSSPSGETPAPGKRVG
jgi:hypothetical protein